MSETYSFLRAVWAYMLQVFNTLAIPVICYTAGIVHWPANAFEEPDRQTRKLLTIYHDLHPRSDVDHLYLPWHLGGRGLCSVLDMVSEECCLFQYVRQSDDPLIIEVRVAQVLKESPTVVIKKQSKSYLGKSLHGYYE